MIFKTVVKGGTLVMPGEGLVQASVAIDDGKIAAIALPGAQLDAAQVIDATGKHVFPGVIDPHTHIGYGGMLEEHFPTETASASIGGVTSVIIFYRPYGQGPVPYDMFPDLKAIAESRAHIDFTFHLAMLGDVQIDQVEKYVRDYRVASFKFYMAYKGEDGRQIGLINNCDDGFLYDAFGRLARFPHVTACTHCENTEVIGRLERRLKAAGRNDLAAWSEARPGFAEAENINRAAYWAELTGARLCVLHLGSREAILEMQRHKQRTGTLYFETCPQYLTLTTDTPHGNLAKVNPPVRSAANVEACWQAIRDGTVDTIGTDHCPIKRARKQGTIWEAAPGFPGIATSFPVLLYEGYWKRGIKLERIAELMSANVARVFSLYPRKGALAVGSDADLAIVDLNLEKTVTAAMLKGYADFSLYEGQAIKGWPTLTLVRGEVVMRDGKIVGKPGHGRFLER